MAAGKKPSRVAYYWWHMSATGRDVDSGGGVGFGRVRMHVHEVIHRLPLWFCHVDI
jgi:hypothetical protein